MSDKYYTDKILDTFQSLIDTIKTHDDSIHFWIQGGALRRVVDESFTFDSNDDWPWPVDIDLHVEDVSNFNKLKEVLEKKMGFKEVGKVGYNIFYQFFSVQDFLEQKSLPFLLILELIQFLIDLYGEH